MHKLAVIRSLTHPNANHVQAALPAMTGRHHPPGTESRGDFPPSSTDFPAIGAVLDQLRPSDGLPTWVQIGPTMTRDNSRCSTASRPDSSARPTALLIDQDLTPDQVVVEAVAPDRGVTPARQGSGAADAARTARRPATGAGQRPWRSAPSMPISSGRSTCSPPRRWPAAFDLAAEPAAIRDAYGRNSVGQSCLLARRLAEAGVPMISVHYCRRPPGWDTHGRHFTAMKESLARRWIVLSPPW